MEPHDHLGSCVTHGGHGGDSADQGHSAESTQPSHHHTKTTTTRPVRSPSSATAATSSTAPTLSSAPPSPSLRNIGNPPPRFFTRPHRRTDHHSSHHHNHSRDHSLHGSGYSGSQASSSLGVRSAFKDFVVPAQIILACSILNAVWPTVLGVVTTMAEFLVLVLSSYSACARRSDQCYFLEPLLQDFDLPEGQEAIYVATIQWSLRILFVGMMAATVAVLGGKAQKIWWTLKSNRQRPRSFWSPQNMMSWVLACPAAAMAYFQRILPWKITRPSSRNDHPSESRQSPNSHRHRPSLGTPSSSTNTNTNISGASSASQPNEPALISTTRKVNYTAFALDDNFSAGSGSETRSKSRAKRKSNNRVNTTTVPHIDRNVSSSSLLAVDSPSVSPSVSNAPSSTPSPSPSPVAQPQDTTTSSSDPTNTSSALVDGTTAEQPETNATYEAEDNENDFISTQDRRRRRKAKALRSNSANQSSESVTKTSHPDQREQHSGSTPLEPPKPSQEHVADKASLTLPQDQNQGQGQFSSRSTMQANQKESSLSPQTSTFNHPLHALNSTSPIVRLKPTHKRSQSAQLPASSPWSIPYLQSGNTRPFQGSSLSQVSLPLENSSVVASHAPVSSTATTTSTTTSTSTSTLTPPPIDTSKTEVQTTESGGYGLFGQSSIWYSPFQSGLDITIEGDQDVRPPKMPKPRIQVQSVANQKKPSLGFLASSSSFFESSPRTPRIMPFSQHHANISDDWSVRARSSSIAAPLTPLLESDCADPMDYFGGSRSANSSRRGSVENNLTESLLSGRARMFASEPNMTNSRPSDLSDLTSSGGSVSNPTLNESTFLSHSHYGSLEPSTTASAFTNMMSTNLAQPSTLDSGLSSNMGSMPGIFPTEESVAPAFVNPWNPPLQYHSHAGSETFLPFGSTTNYDTSSTADMEVSHRRQASLLKLMNGDRDDASLGIHGGASGEQGLRSLNTFGNGFLFPSRDPLTTTSTLPESSSTGGYQPFASIEMSLAAAANQCPVLEDDPKYDFVELAIQSSDFANKKRFDALEGHHNHRGDGHQGPEKKSRGRHGRTRSGHHKSASLGSFFPPMPPNTSSSSSSGLPESYSTAGIQGASGNTDLLRGRHHHGQGPGQGQGQGHSKQGKRHVTESSLSRENSHVDRRRGTKTSGADSDSNHRGNKHQDTKSKRVHKE